MAAARWWGHLPVRCGMACREQNIREQWGCDSPAKPAGYSVDCYSCRGDPRAMPFCGRCGGTGELPLTRCPTALLEGPGEDAFTAWEAYIRYRDGYLPAPGGMLDQTRPFDVMLGYATHMWNHHYSIANDKEERVARAERERAKQAPKVEGRK